MSGGYPTWAVMSPKRLAHVERVAALSERWATLIRIPEPERIRWDRAVRLHDALRDAGEAELRLLAPEWSGPVELLHGPAAANRACADGETDPGVLSAVRYHSVGCCDWDMVGKVLYCADFLEPGRSFDQPERAALADRFPAAPDEVLAEVATRRLAWLVRSRWSIPEETWRFWNSVAGQGWA
jgi:HD superfamily phosphohydrolase YqeK